MSNIKAAKIRGTIDIGRLSSTSRFPAAEKLTPAPLSSKLEMSPSVGVNMMAGKASKKPVKAAKKPPPSEPPRSRSCSPAATRRSRRPTATPPCRPTSRPCPAGSATSGAASTRSSRAPSPACTRRSNGTRPSTASRARAGSSACIASPSTSRWRSSAARRCVLVPPGESKQKDVRYLDIHEDDQLDEAQFAAWVKQASKLPGERM